MSNSRAPKGHVTIGVAAGDPKPHFVRTLFEMTMFDQAHGNRHLHPERPSIWVIGASFVTNARNTIVSQFLAAPDDLEWLLMLDDDQLYPVDTIERLVASADPVQRPIVGLPVWRFASEGNEARVTHNVFTMTEESCFVEWPDELPPNSLVQVAGIGTGCLLVHRSALQRIAEFGFENGFGRNHVWFQQRVHPADFAEGEDLHFCRLAGAAGIPVFCLTSYTLEHVKEIRLAGVMPLGAVTI